MNGPSTAATSPFAAAAALVIRRLWWCRTLRHLTASLPWVASGFVLLAIAKASGYVWSGGGLALGLAALWVVGCAALAWMRRPGPYEAFAFWDSRAGRGDAFANAWWFERQPARAKGSELHWRLQTEALAGALPSLKRDIALPDPRWLAVVPLLLAGLFLIPGGRDASLPDARLTEEGRALAQREGKKLSEKKLDAEKMKALTEAEKKELEKLQQKIAETANSLGQRKAESSREVLSELERRAREAEKLAEKLGAGGDAWASEALVAEMRRHADTAELGDAVAAKSTENTAREAQKLADRLRDPALSPETRDRVAETMREIGRRAEPGDRERTVGEHVLQADRNLAQTLPKEAGDEFQKLADKMKTLASREKAREELEKLAQQMRDAGSKVAGEGTQGMQQLAGSPGQAGQQGPNAQGSQGSSQMLNLQNAPSMQPMQMPGLSDAPQGQGQGQKGGGQQQSLQMMAPGSGKNQDGKNQAFAPGQGKDGPKPGEKPTLFAPVPGGDPNQPPDAAIAVTTPGGRQAGNATADLGKAPTEKIKPGQQGTVNAQRNAEGESSVRSVEGQARVETARRGAQPAALEAIAAEEHALDDAALPAARREQVRRYFNELRKRFEKEN